MGHEGPENKPPLEVYPSVPCVEKTPFLDQELQSLSVKVPITKSWPLLQAYF